jgi:hypothetical protein
MEALLDGESEALTRKAIELALAGDTTALRLCIDRLLPTLRERPVAVELPPLTGPKDAVAASAALLAAVTAGEIAPGEAREIGRLRTSRATSTRSGSSTSTSSSAQGFDGLGRL